MTVRRAGAVGVVATAALGLVAACGGDGGGATVRVLAAASLTDAFEDLAAAFEDREPDVAVELSFDASSSLREQILEGAPADVFASADDVDMGRVVAAGAADGDPAAFASNRLALVVPDGNPGGVSGLADLARDDLLVGLCAPEVPCGRLAGQALERAGVVPALDTEAPDVRDLLTQLAAGELDVGITYRTDAVAAADEVDDLPIEGPAAVEARLPIVVLDDAGEPEQAAAFVGFVRSPAGQRILAEHGFGPP